MTASRLLTAQISISAAKVWSSSLLVGCSLNHICLVDWSKDAVRRRTELLDQAATGMVRRPWKKMYPGAGCMVVWWVWSSRALVHVCFGRRHPRHVRLLKHTWINTGIIMHHTRIDASIVNRDVLNIRFEFVFRRITYLFKYSYSNTNMNNSNSNDVKQCQWRPTVEYTTPVYIWNVSEITATHSNKNIKSLRIFVTDDSVVVANGTF